MKTLIAKGLVLAISSGVIFTGCVKMPTSSSKAQSTSIPNWYINSPSNNAQYLYGTGESGSVNSARDEALNNMSARLVTSVGSSITKTTKASSSSDGSSSYSKDVSKQLKVEVQNIKFTNAKIEKNAVVGNNYYVLAKVDRVELFNSKKKDFSVIDTKIDTRYKQLQSFKKLEKINALTQLYPDIIKAKKLAFVSYAINNSFDYAPYHTKYDKMIDEINSLKDSLTISVSTNLSERYFADELISALNSQNYKTKDGSSDVSIKVNNKVRYSVARGWQIAKVSTTLSVVSHGRVISNTTINSVGRSSSTKANALDGASKHFKTELAKKGLNSILFSN
jgi:hypothetical protein